jgi:hypothetical protein
VAGEKMCLNVHVFVNCTAHDGTTYKANFTDPVSTMTLSFDLEEKSQLLECFPLVIAQYHKKYGLTNWKVLICDQERI